jgi:hypothetical protein
MQWHQASQLGSIMELFNLGMVSWELYVVKISERWKRAEVFQLSVGTDQQESMRIFVFSMHLQHLLGVFLAVNLA